MHARVSAHSTRNDCDWKRRMGGHIIIASRQRDWLDVAISGTWRMRGNLFTMPSGIAAPIRGVPKHEVLGARKASSPQERHHHEERQADIRQRPRCHHAHAHMHFHSKRWHLSVQSLRALFSVTIFGRYQLIVCFHPASAQYFVMKCVPITAYCDHHRLKYPVSVDVARMLDPQLPTLLLFMLNVKENYRRRRANATATSVTAQHGTSWRAGSAG